MMTKSRNDLPRLPRQRLKTVPDSENTSPKIMQLTASGDASFSVLLVRLSTRCATPIRSPKKR